MKYDSNIYISILVAAYNMQDTLDRCIQSLIHQTMKNIEIIIVDDGSTDNTGVMCDNYALQDSRIRVIHQKNLGLPMARQAGLKAATGKYISYVDSDDWCEYDMCEKLYEKAIKFSADLVFCSAFRHRNDGIAKICNLPISTGLYSIKQIYDCYILPLYGDLKSDKLITTGYVWCCLFKKEILSKIKFYKDICLHEDEIIIIQSLINAKKIYITDEQLYHYNRMSPNSLSKRTIYWNNYWGNMVSVYKSKEEFAKSIFKNENEYMYRLVTNLYLKFLRSIRNETHYTNPKGFWGGLCNVYKLKDKELLLKNKKYILKTEFTFSEKILVNLIQMRLFFLVYFYYSIACNRMRTYTEKTKN
ncbi:glycosyltransferase family 2 protein [Clostridium butyricum]|jgi:glycosyltransferase involved in cell wall biosynthesis|uniref:glycosyltransferase family 2 protein n=1 Tax=Clostridium butyricum TaxID=1492 RepID=UPI003465C0F1